MVAASCCISEKIFLQSYLILTYQLNDFSLRLRKKAWLLYSSYNSKKTLVGNHLNCIDRNLDSQLGQYENFIFIGDFNVESNDATMKNLSDLRLQKYCQIPVLKIP